jgi:hypothetical protein
VCARVHVCVCVHTSTSSVRREGTSFLNHPPGAGVSGLHSEYHGQGCTGSLTAAGKHIVVRSLLTHGGLGHSKAGGLAGFVLPWCLTGQV